MRDVEQRRAYWRDRYRNDPAYKRQQLTNRIENYRKRAAECRPLISEFRKEGCRLCTEKDSCCLVAHHTDPKQKELSLGKAYSGRYSVEQIRKELLKCVCLCQNCHHKLHTGKLGLDLSLRPLEQ